MDQNPSFQRIQSVLQQAADGLLQVVQRLRHSAPDAETSAETLQYLEAARTAYQALGVTSPFRASMLATSVLSLGKFSRMPQRFYANVMRGWGNIITNEDISTEIKEQTARFLFPFLATRPHLWGQFVGDIMENAPELAPRLGLHLQEATGYQQFLRTVGEIFNQFPNYNQRRAYLEKLGPGGALLGGLKKEDFQALLNRLESGTLTEEDLALLRRVAPLARFTETLNPDVLQNLKKFIKAPLANLPEGWQEPQVKQAFQNVLSQLPYELSPEELKMGQFAYRQFQEQFGGLPPWEDLTSFAQSFAIGSFKGNVEEMLKAQVQLSQKDSANINRLRELFTEELQRTRKILDVLQKEGRDKTPKTTFYTARLRTLEGLLEPGVIESTYSLFGRDTERQLRESLSAGTIRFVKQAVGAMLSGFRHTVPQETLAWMVEQGTEDVLHSADMRERLSTLYYTMYQNNQLRRLWEAPLVTAAGYALKQAIDVGEVMAPYLSLDPAQLIKSGMGKMVSMGAPLELQIGGRLGLFQRYRGLGGEETREAFSAARRGLTSQLASIGLPYDQIQRVFNLYTGIAGVGQEPYPSGTELTDLRGQLAPTISNRLGQELSTYLLLAQMGGYRGNEEQVTRVLAQTQRLLRDRSTWYTLSSVFFETLTNKDLKTVIGTDEILSALQSLPEMATRFGGLSPEAYAGYLTAFRYLTQNGIPTVRGLMGMEALGGIAQNFMSAPGRPFSPLLALALGSDLGNYSFADLAALQVAISEKQLFTPVSRGGQQMPLINALIQGVLGLTGESPNNANVAALFLSTMGLGDPARLRSIIQVFSTPEAQQALSAIYAQPTRTFTTPSGKTVPFGEFVETASVEEIREMLQKEMGLSPTLLTDEFIQSLKSMTQTSGYNILQNIADKEETIINSVRALTETVTTVGDKIAHAEAAIVEAINSTPIGRGFSTGFSIITSILGSGAISGLVQLLLGRWWGRRKGPPSAPGGGGGGEVNIPTEAPASEAPSSGGETNIVAVPQTSILSRIWQRLSQAGRNAARVFREPVPESRVPQGQMLADFLRIVAGTLGPLVAPLLGIKAGAGATAGIVLQAAPGMAQEQAVSPALTPQTFAQKLQEYIQALTESIFGHRLDFSDIPERIAGTIRGVTDSILNALKPQGEIQIPFVSQFVNYLNTTLQSIIKAPIETSGIINRLKETIHSLFDTLISALRPTEQEISWFTEFKRNIVQQVKDKVTTVGAAINPAVLAGAVLATRQAILHPTSPAPTAPVATSPSTPSIPSPSQTTEEPAIPQPFATNLKIAQWVREHFLNPITQAWVKAWHETESRKLKTPVRSEAEQMQDLIKIGIGFVAPYAAPFAPGLSLKATAALDATLPFLQSAPAGAQTRTPWWHLPRPTGIPQEITPPPKPTIEGPAPPSQGEIPSFREFQEKGFNESSLEKLNRTMGDLQKALQNAGAAGMEVTIHIHGDVSESVIQKMIDELNRFRARGVNVSVR